MGWGKPKVPNTISDRKMKDLQRRGSKANAWFTDKAIKQRKASEAQRKKAGSS